MACRICDTRMPIAGQPTHRGSAEVHPVEFATGAREPPRFGLSFIPVDSPAPVSLWFLGAWLKPFFLIRGPVPAL